MLQNLCEIFLELIDPIWNRDGAEGFGIDP